MAEDPKSDGFEVATIRQTRLALLPKTPPAAFLLEVTEGPDKGSRFTFDERQPSPAFMGQSPACTFRLTDREVSRRHASFEIDGQRLRITDLTSTNGTLIGDVAIADAFVRPGQSIRVGATTIRVARSQPEVGGDTPADATGYGHLLGASVQMRRLYPLFERLATSELPLIVEGETGTGKELLAEAIHSRGPRAAEPFVIFDCTAASSEAHLFESFVLAHGGTLFLDEVGELDLGLQPKLLRFIERGEIASGNQRRTIDVRIIASTHRNLDHDIQVGRFREDLFHRLVVTRIGLPPLRKRSGDIEVLAKHFIRSLHGEADSPAIPPLVLSRWRDYAWPGNVRELKNAVARMLVTGELAGLGESVSDGDEERVGPASPVSRFVECAMSEGLPLAPARQRIVQVYDRYYVEQILAKHHGNVTRAASAAGVERRYFQILRARTKET